MLRLISSLLSRLPLFAMCIMLCAAGCARSAESSALQRMAAPPAPEAPPGPAAGSGDGSRQASTIHDRRIIRTAEISLEVDAPDAVQSRVTVLAESTGGFVVNSETARSFRDDGEQTITVTIVIRVPAAAFGSTLESLRGLGKHVSGEKVTGEDVTEEYVDLEARIRAQRAVEDQYLYVLKEAKAIPDILAVEEKLGEVRTEIERAEGRRRFLEDRTKLSTLTVHLARHVEALEASGPGFGSSVRKAGRDAMDVSIGIVNGAIRLCGVLLPIGILLGLPGWLFGRFLWRRRQRSA